MEKYATKLASKLSGLQETSSNETRQTLAKWIAFHRKHADRLIPVLMGDDGSNSTGSASGVLHPTKGAQTVAVVSELLLLDRDLPARWERLADLRVAVGEQLLRTIATAATATTATAADSDEAAALAPATVEKLSSLLPEWDKHNVFGGPTLIHQLKRQLSSSSSSSRRSSPEKASKTKKPLEPAGAAAIKTAKVQARSVKEEKEDENDDDDETVKESPAEEKELKRKQAAPAKMEEEEEKEAKKAPSAPSSPATVKDPSTTSTKDTTRTTATSTKTAAPSHQHQQQQQQQQQNYDFESKNIPERTVEPRQFLEPCRAIATLQIARDLRNDNAVQLSSLLQGVPEDVRAFTAEAAEAEGGAVDLDETKARDFSVRTADQLLDADLPEALQNVRTLRDILRQQSAARRQLLELLVASRCQFGADNVAAAYQSMTVRADEWKRRSQILADAMELEGLDIAEMDDNGGGGGGSKTPKARDKLDEELPPLAWYQPPNNDGDGDNGDGVSNKRQKVE